MHISRWKRLCLLASLWLCLTPLVRAQAVLNPVQQRRAAHLYTEFIAPCCWRQSVAVHQSEASVKVRSEIDSKILLGDSDDQIKAALVKEYGHGILMEPEGIRALLAYSLPALVFLAGLIIVGIWIRNNRQTSRDSFDSAGVSAGQLPELEFD